MQIPADWLRAAEAIAERHARRVLILGPVDAGKSTFARFLLENAAERGAVAVVLDADVGQKSFGPPACITLSEPGVLTLDSLVFVGATNPLRRFRRTIDATRAVADAASGDLLIVNTSGLLAGAGRALKRAKIAAVRPDALVVLGAHPALTPIVNDHGAIPVLHVSISPEARRKTEGQRRRARAEAFRQYFDRAAAVSLPSDRLTIDCDTDAPDLLPERLLVGVTARDGREVMGVVLSHSADQLQVLLPAPFEMPGQLVCGVLALDDEFRAKPIGT
jgi:polynucleotide 5'-hydroxyl-kinase GRC3/NOL9